MRQDRLTISVAVTIDMGVNGDGQRDVLGMKIRPSATGTFWTDLPLAS